MGTETELKFALDPDTLERVRVHPLLRADEVTTRVRSTYFDTRDRALLRAGYGLRLRETPDGWVQTLKSQGSERGVAHDEWETPLRSMAIDRDALAATPAGRLLRSARLEPVFTTDVQRSARCVHAFDARIEATIDVGELRAGERSEPVLELELELLEGDAQSLFMLGREVARSCPVRYAFDSKAARGYRLAGDADALPCAPLLCRGLPASEAFRRIARDLLARASAEADALRSSLQPRAIHRMRIELRRLRAALKAFAPLVSDEALGRLEDELRWLAGQLDAARNLDVFLQDAGARAAGPGRDDSALALERRLADARARAYAEAGAALRSQRCATLVFDLLAWIEVGPWSRAADDEAMRLARMPIERFARKALARARKKVDIGGRAFERLSPAERHRLRIRFKRLRYAAEFFAPLFERPPQAEAFIGALERVQDALGALQDLAVARDRMVSLAGLDDPQAAFAAGRLVGRREAAEPACIDEAAVAVERLRSTPAFWR